MAKASNDHPFARARGEQVSLHETLDMSRPD